MVLQNRYKRAASARYNNTPSSTNRSSSTPSEPSSRPLEGEEDVAGNEFEARTTFRRRGLHQEERYKELEEEEPTEEDLAIEEQKAEELEAFLQQQGKQQPSFALAPGDGDGDQDDVDDSFAHLRRRTTKKLGAAPSLAGREASPRQHADDDTSERLRSARALKARLQPPRRSSEQQLKLEEAPADVDDLLCLHRMTGHLPRASDLNTHEGESRALTLGPNHTAGLHILKGGLAHSS
ncbi:hypothetical protein BCR35DRAFT_311086 [Leucosporidium creatinivorum]|uniref:Uncharacterized protein n=1 Tax=Leucosporidium creatinivorum TaxID=106004 RepID=A0A1Y2CEE4_9BASI|nr:hypothetical protein BCR35DRAFT_311086 [Leucosporidium creatinivorum]